jgi:orotidine-5'-phosphate decarboxylase
MTQEDIFQQILSKQSYLCVGLDTDPRLLPDHLRSQRDPVYEFNRQIIDATADLCVAYKPNLAFYEAQGPRGWESLQKTLEYIPREHFTIADAKRGDIGNTSGLYARAFFDRAASGLDFDSVTVAPYMGRDSVMPFLDFPGKWVILLALTSNRGSADFQRLSVGEVELFEKVISTSQSWMGKTESEERLMYVVGATQAAMLQRIRQLAPDHFLLVPGVGAQGGSLEEVSRFGMNRRCGLLVNASRSILYASQGEDFAAKARIEAQTIQGEMKTYLERYL